MRSGIYANETQHCEDTVCLCPRGRGGGWEVLRLQGVLMGDRTVDGFCVQ